MVMTDAQRAEQARKEALALDREARENAERANKPKEATGLASFLAGQTSSATTPPPSATAPTNPISLPSLPNASGGQRAMGFGGFGASGSGSGQQQLAPPGQPPLSTAGLFGPAPSPSTQPQQGLSILGAASNNQNRPPQLSLLGAGSQQQVGTGALGAPPAPTQTNPTSTFGSSGFGSGQSLARTFSGGAASGFGGGGGAGATFGQAGGSSLPNYFTSLNRPLGQSTVPAPNSWSQPQQQQLQQQPQQQPSLLGSMMTPGQQTSLGLSALSSSLRSTQGPATQTINPQPLQNVDGPKIVRFEDLQPGSQAILRELDEFIQASMDSMRDIKTRTLGNELRSTSQSIRKAKEDLRLVSDNIQFASTSAKAIRQQAEADLRDASIAVGIIDKFHGNPKQPAHAQWQIEHPVRFFARTEAQLRERLAHCKNTMQQIESLIRDSYRHEQRSAKEIVNSISNQNDSLMALASQTAELDAKVQQLKADYTRLYRAKTGSVRDPFENVHTWRDV